MIGDLRHRVTIIEVTQGQPDGMGGYLPIKSDAAEVGANVSELDQRRESEAQTSYSRILIEVVIRASSNASATRNLIRYDGDEYTLNSVLTDAKKEYTTAEAWQ